MRVRLLLLIVSLAGTASMEAEAPWTSLSAARWREVTGKSFPATWNVQDGVLRALNVPGGLQDICTTEEFTSFELTLQWRLEDDGNSGVKYLIQKRDEWTNASGRQARARGPEFQLAGPLEPDGRSNPKRSSGSLYSLLAPGAAAGPPMADGFNALRLVVQRNRVEHWLNGVLVLSYDPQAPEVQALLQQQAGPNQPVKLVSPVCLQNHGSPAWFRNIRVRPLD